MSKKQKPKGRPAKPDKSGSDNVIFLSYRSPHMVEDQRALLACRNCSNKTFKFILDDPDGFPLMQCCACDQHMGRMGWWHDDDD